MASQIKSDEESKTEGVEEGRKKERAMSRVARQRVKGNLL